jgi:oxygen-independent coproporphyrinogen-3 oxidase
LLDPDEIALIIRSLRDRFDLASDAEITLETNPETVDRDKLERFRGAGVNRISFGVQSFQDDELKRLGRIHSAGRARAAVREARAAAFDNVSLDLMMWLPGQTVHEWLESVDAAIALAPDHLSLYMLEVYPNSPLKDEMARSAWTQAADADVASMYLTALERLDASGYEQYEISNVARPGRRSRHNLKYWTDGEWVGFGCGAHSTVDGARWKNVSGTEDYVARIERHAPVAVDVRRLSLEERLGDALFTGLRLSDGIDVASVSRAYSVDIRRRYEEALAPFVGPGLLEITPARWRLTRAGMLVAHEVMTVFV